MLPLKSLVRFLLVSLRFLRDAVRLGGEEKSKRSLPSSEKMLTRPSETRKHSKGESMTRAYDRIYREEGRDLPLPFLRALAFRESRNNPKQASGPAWGLLQVGIDERAGNVLKSYNERHNTNYSRRDMLDPRINVRVAAELLARIVRMYIADGLEPNWENGNWVGIVTAGWNTGYSRKAGVGRVIRYLKKKGIPITLSAVYANAAKAAPDTKAGKAFVKRLKQPKRQKWHRSVVRSTFAEQGILPSPESKGKFEWLPIALALLFLR